MNVSLIPGTPPEVAPQPRSRWAAMTERYAHWDKPRVIAGLGVVALGTLGQALGMFPHHEAVHEVAGVVVAVDLVQLGEVAIRHDIPRRLAGFSSDSE